MEFVSFLVLGRRLNVSLIGDEIWPSIVANSFLQTGSAVRAVSGERNSVKKPPRVHSGPWERETKRGPTFRRVVVGISTLDGDIRKQLAC